MFGCFNGPVAVVIIVEVKVLNVTAVVVLVFVFQLSQLGPVIFVRTVVLVKLLVKQMVLVRCLGKVDAVITLAVPHIVPDLGFNVVTVKVFGSICCNGKRH